ncbi:MAG: DNA cytosine methyltransferase [Alistipes sp.]|jgi:DNA (cytosine-5)-methyltransferase 1|nr:DNA cytosine methyltransferase [Alistipes sp.]
MRHASLFSGIGGFDLAARWMGWENVFHSEIDPFCLTILKHNFPDAITYTDIRNTDFTPWRDRIDVLSGGFPCQPFSQAGKRKGTADDRHLWPEMLRAIREIEPRWVVGENVLGITNWNGGMVFEQVCADLEAEGYSVQPTVLPACGAGAPHQRYRTWFVAHRNDDQLFAGLPLPEQIWASLASDGGTVADPDRDGDRLPNTGGVAQAQGDEEPLGTQYRSAGEPCRTDTLGNERRHAHGYVSDNTGEYADVRYSYGDCTCTERGASEEQGAEPCGVCRIGCYGSDSDGRTAAYTDVVRPENVQSEGDGQNDNPCQRGDVHGGTADDGPERVAPDPDGQMPQCRDDEGAEGRDFERFGVESFGGAFCWDDFPAVSPVCSRDDGFPIPMDGITFSRWRKESIKAYGNAIVPQIAYRIFRVIEFMGNGK